MTTYESWNAERTVSDEAIDWLVLLHSGRASDADRRRCAAWCASSLAHEQAFREAETLWGQLEDLRAVTVDDGRTAREGSGRRRILRSLTPVRRWASAAAALVLIVAGVWALGSAPSLKALVADHRTGTGEQRVVRLPDGSRIHLNTATALDVRFSPSERVMKLLEGEAVFTVASDPDRPFRVNSPGLTSEALGTVFVVRTEGERSAVTVLEHAVRVATRDGRPEGERRLREGQRVWFDSDAGFSEVEPVNLNTAAAWRRSKLIFDAQPLDAVLVEIDRYRSGSIVLLNPSLSTLKVTGVVPLGNPDDALETITRTLPVRLTRLTPYLIVLH